MEDIKLSTLEKSLEIYKKIKRIINKGNFAIKNGKVTTVEMEPKSQSNEKDDELEY